MNDLDEHRTFHQSCDEDWAKFIAVPGRVYTILTKEVAGEAKADTEIFLYRNNGSLLTLVQSHNNISTTNKFSQISTTLTAGEYAVQVKRINPSGTQHYKLQISDFCYNFLNNEYPVTDHSLVCSTNKSFVFQNLYPGATVAWENSANLTFVSGQGTNTYTVKAASSTTAGSGWLRVTTSLAGCIDVVIPNVTFWVGRAPAAEGIDIVNVEDPMSLCPATQYIVEAYWEWSTNMPPIIEYEWMLPSGWTSVEAGSQNPFTHDDFLIRVNAKSLVQPAFIRVRGKNECGSFGLPTFLYVDTECEPYFFSIYPNPVDNYLDVEFEDGEYKSSKSPLYEIIILDNNGLEKLRTSTNDNSKRIDTSSLSNGQYFIQLLYKGKVLQRQIIINR
jgi:hypothetical protein